MIYLVVSIKYRHVTDRQTSCDSIVRAMHIYVSRGKTSVSKTIRKPPLTKAKLH